MKCQVCDELQTSRYITYKDLPICEEDYKVCTQHTWMMIAKQLLQNLSGGDGRQNFWRKMRKVRGSLLLLLASSAAQLPKLSLAKKVMGGAHICRTSEFMQMGIFGVAQEWSLLVQRLFQVSYWPCICHSKSASEPNLFSLSEECHPP